VAASSAKASTPPVHPDLARARREPLGEAHQQIEARIGQREPEPRAERGEDRRLGEQQGAQPAAVGAEGPADG
jgi:hypothetical protein